MTDNITKLFTDTLVLDTETTSLDFKKAEVIEYSSASVLEIIETVAAEEYSILTDLYQPSEPLLSEVSAITSISNRMLEKDAIGSFSEYISGIQAVYDTHEYYVAHNAFYDFNVLSRYGLKMPKQICTMRLAKKLYVDDTNITAYNLAYLRYALNVPVSDTLIAHRADADVMITGMLFALLVDKAIMDGKIDGNADDLGQEIVDWLDEPVITKIMPFGKHKGKKMEEVPLSYWSWATENMDSLQESKPEYDKDFAASVAIAVEKIFETQS